jgi:hypothetical protein
MVQRARQIGPLHRRNDMLSNTFLQEMIMKFTGLWAGIVLTFGNTSSVYLWFISPSIGGLLRRSTHA